MKPRKVSAELREPKFTKTQEVTHLKTGKHGVILEGWWDSMENRYLVHIRAFGIENGVWSIPENGLKIRDKD